MSRTIERAAPVTVELPCVCGARELGASLVFGRSRSGELVDIRPCLRCGLRRTYPPPDVKELLAGDYQDESDFANQVRNIAKFRAYAQRLLGTVARTFPQKKVRLLDVGCGIGALLLEGRQRGWDVHGLDVNQKAAAFGREHFELDIRSGAVEALMDADERYDAIILSQVLEHLERPHETLRTLARLAARGGIIAIESPNMDGLYPRVLRAWWYPYGVSQHLWHFTPSTMHVVAAAAGLRLVETHASHCVDYNLPAALTPLVDLPGAINAGDNMIAVFAQR